MEMYEQNDVLAQFRNHALEVIDDVPPEPAKGSLDIRDVLKSDYFFA